MSEKPVLHTADEMKKAAGFDSLHSKLEATVRSDDFDLPETLKNLPEGNIFSEEQVMTFVFSLLEASSQEAILKAMIDTFGKKKYQE